MKMDRQSSLSIENCYRYYQSTPVSVF